MDSIIRVVLLHDCSIHILMANKRSVLCTVPALKYVLTDPYDFLEKGCNHYRLSTQQTFAGYDSIEDVPGLTLLRVTRENQIVCEFNILFKLMFDCVTIKDSSPLCANKNLMEYHVADEKEFFVNFFLELAYMRNQGFVLDRKISLSKENKSKYFQEIVNTHFSELKPERKEISLPQCEASTEAAPDSIFPSSSPAPNITDIPSNYVTLSAYCEATNANYFNALSWAKKGALCTARQDSSRHWWVDPNDKPKLKRNRTQKSQPGRSRRKNKYELISLKEESYEALQSLIKERGYFTDAVRPYIRSKAELHYYLNHRYREILLDGFSYLILDINPDYYSEKHKMTNRQLIASGNAPVVPNDEDNPYILHHIGQQPDSPLAIIPQRDHQDLFSDFHQKASPEGIDRKSFRLFKEAFWKKYLLLYDDAGKYSRIQYLNHYERKEKPKYLKESV